MLILTPVYNVPIPNYTSTTISQCDFLVLHVNCGVWHVIQLWQFIMARKLESRAAPQGNIKHYLDLFSSSIDI